MSTRQVQVRITGDPSRLGAAFRQSSRDASQFGTTLKGHVGGALGTATRGAMLLGAGLTVGAAIGFKKALSAAGEFEKTLNVFKATAGATGDQMRLVSDAAIKLGADTKLPGTSASDAAQAMTELAKGGLSVQRAMDAARGTLELSAAAEISNAQAATIVADNLNAFGLAGADAARIADLLAASANATTASMPEMADALKMSAAVAHSMGIPVEELVTELGQLANAGIKGSDAGTSVKTMLLSLAAPTSKAKQLMEDLNVKVFDQAGKFRGMPAVISDFNRALSGMSDAQRTATLKTLFGSDAIRAANIVLGGAKAKHDALAQAVTKTGAASDLAAAQTQGWEGALEGFRSTIETIEVTIGTKLLPVATDLLNWLSANLPGAVSAAIGALTPLGNTIADIASVIGRIAQRVSAADGIHAKIGVLLDIGRTQLDRLRRAVEGIDWGAVAHTIGEKLSSVGRQIRGAVEAVDWAGIADTIGTTLSRVAARVREAFDAVDWGAVGESIRSRLAAVLATAGGVIGAVDWDAVGTRISDAISRGIQITQTTASRIVGELAAAVNDNRGALVEVGASLAIGIVARLVDPGFWLQHWQEALAIALTVIPIGRAASLGEKLGVALLRPFGRIGVRLGELLFRALESLSISGASIAERLGGRLVDGAVRGFAWLGAKLSAPLRAGLARLGPVGRWLAAKIEQSVAAAAGALRRIGTALVRKVSDGILAAPGLVRRAAQSLATWVTSKLTEAWRGLPRLVRFLVTSAVINTITSGISAAWNAASRLGTRVKDGVVSGVTGVANRVGEVIGNIPGKIEAWAGSIASSAASIGSTIYDNIIGGIGDIGGDIAAKVRDAVNSVLSLIDGISLPQQNLSTPRFRIGIPGTPVGVDVPSVGFSIGPYDLTPYGLPRLAQGGIVRARPGGVALVAGEAGADELIEPLPRGGILNRQGGDTITVNVAGRVIGDRDLEDIVVAAINRAGRRKGRVVRTDVLRLA